MGRLTDRIQAGGLLWLQADAYAGALLGSPQWLDVGRHLAWRRQVQGLLRSDVMALELASVTDELLRTDPALLARMRERSRATAPLQALLADPGLRQHLGDLLRGLRDSFAALPLALVLPSPRAWLSLAHAQAFDTPAQVGEDEIDDAAVYLTDFLRSFSASGVDALLLTESADDPPAAAAQVAWYQPVFNLAAHQRWELGLRLACAPAELSDMPGLDFVIAHDGPATGRWRELPQAAGETAFLYLDIPAEARPESVLTRLEVLRAVNSPRESAHAAL